MQLPKTLRDSAYMKAAKINRAKRLESHEIPAYHYVCSDHYMNDPNGLCYFRGRWHLFYQLMTGYGIWNWAHAVSEDLVHWKELPLVISPEPNENEASSWSGATCVRDDRVVALYYGYSGNCGLYCQTSDDDFLLDWKRVKTGPVIPCGRMDDPEYTRVPYAVAPAVYDSCIWFEDGLYYALSAGVQKPDDRCFVREEYIFSSPDLIHWTYLHPFLKNDRYGSVYDDGACPYFVKIGEDMRLLLTYSHCNGPEYLLGKLDKTDMTFDVSGGFRINPISRECGYAAPTAYADPSGDGSVRAFYVMHMPDGISCMSLPHTITLDRTKTHIAVSPAKELESLRTNYRSATDIALPANTETVIPCAAGRSVEIDLILSMEPKVPVEFHVLRSKDGKQYTSFTVYSERGRMLRDADDWHRESILSIDCSRSSSKPWQGTPEAVSFYKEDGAPFHLRIFIDKSVVEVFTTTGQSLGKRVLPDADSDTFSVTPLSGDAEIRALHVWDMENINETASDL